MPIEPYVANTDAAWFRFLSELAPSGRLDEANFWSPKAIRPLARMRPGTPVFLRLKSPHGAIAGYGFFAHFCVVSLEHAWELFGIKNGDPGYERFLARIGAYRGLDLFDPASPRLPLGCTILRDLQFWPSDRWIPWASADGWARNIVKGKIERDPARASRLLAEIQYDQMEPPDLAPVFEPLDIDQRRLVLARHVQREGQGTFRARLLDAYGRRCAITGERTQPVLDAAHIQPYVGPPSNHVQNGLLLTKEFHTLFDRGYVAVSPEHRVLVSPRLREEWENGKRYYAYDGRPLTVLPSDPERAPSRAALEWHLRRVYRG